MSFCLATRLLRDRILPPCDLGCFAGIRHSRTPRRFTRHPEPSEGFTRHPEPSEGFARHPEARQRFYTSSRTNVRDPPAKNKEAGGFLVAGARPCSLTSPLWGSCAASSKCSCKQAFLLASGEMTVKNKSACPVGVFSFSRNFVALLREKIREPQKKQKPHISAHSDGTFGTIYRVRWWGRQNSNL